MLFHGAMVSEKRCFTTVAGKQGFLTEKESINKDLQVCYILSSQNVVIEVLPSCMLSEIK